MTDRDITDLARELLTIDTSAIGGSIIVDGVDVLETVRAAQTVARAVIELTAERDAYREENTRLREQVARVRTVADELEAAAQPGTFTGGRQLYCAHRIRAALNGETHD